jgi:hypothetical protein
LRRFQSNWRTANPFVSSLKIKDIETFESCRYSV